MTQPTQTLAPLTLWFTGLCGAGKSTLARHLQLALLAQGYVVVVLDGDVIRKGISCDLGFDAASRTENLRRIAHIAKLLNDQGIFAICATISPMQDDRHLTRTIVGATHYMEIYVSTPLAVCEQRDPKGLYKLARSGKIDHFTGITAPYEPPLEAAVTINTVEMAPDEAIQHIINTLHAVQSVQPDGAQFHAVTHP